jgi:hypothetical protein
MQELRINTAITRVMAWSGVVLVISLVAQGVLMTSPTAGCRRLLFTRPAREGPVQPVRGCVRRVRRPESVHDRMRCNEIPLA